MKIVDLHQLPEQRVSHNPRIRKKVMVGFPELMPLTQFAQAVFPPGEIADGHRHADMHEVFFVEQGAGEICIDGNVTALQAGMCAVVECGEIHELRNTGTTDMIVTYFGVRVTNTDEGKP